MRRLRMCRSSPMLQARLRIDPVFHLVSLEVVRLLGHAETAFSLSTGWSENWSKRYPNLRCLITRYLCSRAIMVRRRSFRRMVMFVNTGLTVSGEVRRAMLGRVAIVFH